MTQAEWQSWVGAPQGCGLNSPLPQQAHEPLLPSFLRTWEKSRCLLNAVGLGSMLLSSPTVALLNGYPLSILQRGRLRPRAAEGPTQIT